MIIFLLIVGICASLSFAQEIITNPSSKTIFAEQHAVFACQTRDIAGHWRVNDTKINELPSAIQNDLDPDINPLSVFYLLTLNITGKVEYNKTRVQCAYEHPVGTLILSETAILTIQDVLGPVKGLVANTNSSSVTVNWTAPFSLDVTGVDPDIWYSVIIYNVTDESNPTVMDCTDCINTTDTHYTFTPNSPGLCHQYFFTVVPVNGAGIGEATNLTSFLHNKTVITDLRLFNMAVSKLSSAEYKIQLAAPLFIEQDKVVCFQHDMKLHYVITQKYCPTVVAEYSPQLSSKNEWMIVSIVSLGENCDYTLHLSSYNYNTTLYFSTKVVIVEVRQEKEAEREVEVKCVFRHTLSDSCYVQLVSDMEGGFHQKYCVEDEEKKGEGIARFSNLLPAIYTILVNGLSGENSSCSSGGDTPDYITVITVGGHQPTPIISQPSRTVDNTGPLSSRASNPLCAEGIGIGVCLGVFSMCLLFIFGIITIKVVVKMKGRKGGGTQTVTVPPAQKMAMERNMAYELHKPPSLRRGPPNQTLPSDQNPVYEDLK